MVESLGHKKFVVHLLGQVLVGQVFSLLLQSMEMEASRRKESKMSKNNVSGHCNTPHRFQLTLLTIATLVLLHKGLAEEGRPYFMEAFPRNE